MSDRDIAVRARWTMNSEPGYWIGVTKIAHMDASDCGRVEIEEAPWWPQDYRDALEALVEAVRKQRAGDNTFAADEDVRVWLDRVIGARPVAVP